MSNELVQFALAFFAGLMSLTVGVPFLLGLFQLFGIYTVVRERQCQVFVLFGNVLIWTL